MSSRRANGVVVQTGPYDYAESAQQLRGRHPPITSPADGLGGDLGRTGVDIAVSWQGATSLGRARNMRYSTDQDVPIHHGGKLMSSRSLRLYADHVGTPVGCPR